MRMRGKWWAALLALVVGGAGAQVLTPRVHEPVAGVSLAWDISVDVTVTGYRLYREQVGGTNLLTDVGNTNFATSWWTNPPYGQTFSFQVTAYDSAGQESVPSNAVQWTIPLPSTNVVLTVTGGVEMSRDLRTWAPNFEDPYVRTNEPGPLFFRNELMLPEIAIAHF